MPQTREFDGRQVVICFVHPPIPDRNSDYQAFFDGDDECGPFGWGETADEAFWALVDQLEDDRQEEG